MWWRRPTRSEIAALFTPTVVGLKVAVKVATAPTARVCGAPVTVNEAASAPVVVTDEMVSGVVPLLVTVTDLTGVDVFFTVLKTSSAGEAEILPAPVVTAGFTLLTTRTASW